MVHERLKCDAVAIQVPVGKEENFRGIIDLIEMNADIYYDEMGKDMRVEEIPEEMTEIVHQARTKLIDAISNLDDDIMMLALDEKPIPPEMIRNAIRRGTVNNEFVPVVCGTSYKNKGER